jgi:hypothetical protein
MNHRSTMFNRTLSFFMVILLFSCSNVKKEAGKSVQKKTLPNNVFNLSIESPAEFSAQLFTQNKKGEAIEVKQLLSFDTLDTIGRAWKLKISVPGKFELDTLLEVKSSKQFKSMLANCFTLIPFQRPKNATFQYVNGAFKPIEAIEGNQLDTAKLTLAILQSIKANKNELTLERDNFYKKPSYHLSDVKTQQGLSALRKCLSAKITLEFKSKDVVIDKSTFGSWLTLDSMMRVNFISTKSVSFVQDLAAKYDEIIPSVSITSSKGEPKTIRGGDIGTRLSVFKELSKILENVRNAEVVSREPNYAMKGLPAGVFDSNKTYVEISISDQKLWYYKNGSLVIESSVVTGCPKQGHSTPGGAYYVKYMQTNATLEGPGYSAHVRYWMPFNNGIGLHDAQWRNKFGEAIYLADGSHGCINLPFSTAQTIYQTISPGTIVLLY